jgi:hypothetical protein
MLRYIVVIVEGKGVEENEAGIEGEIELATLPDL